MERPPGRPPGSWTAAQAWPSVGTVIEVREATGPESARWQEDRRLSLNVFGSNAGAARLYRRMGGQTVDQSRSIDL
jgi:hypothetical protein